MTAVAQPPSLSQNLNRSAWGSNGSSRSLHSMSADDVQRMLMPSRKTATRSNSSTSLASTSSTATAVSAPPVSAVQSNPNDASRKSRVRYLWPMSKTDPSPGLSNGRSQSMPPSSSGASASGVSALHMPNSNSALNHQSMDARQPGQTKEDNTPVLYLTPINGTFERKTLRVPFYPDVIRLGRQTNKQTIPTAQNGFFDSKVLSRQHAEVWADRGGKIWIRDIKSSNGTFVNGQRLSGENKDSDPHEIREQDVLELGIDIVGEDQKGIMHHKVAARVEFAGFIIPPSLLDALTLSDIDPTNLTTLIQLQLSGFTHLRRNSVPTGYPARQGSYPRQQPGFLLGPVSMEQVIKRLSAEYKFAKQQSEDLTKSTQFLDTVLNSSPPQKDSSALLHSEPVKAKSPSRDGSVKLRFSNPPNPPPQAPLPEKPSMPNPSYLKRSESERPTLSNGVHHTARADSTSHNEFLRLTEALEVSRRDLDVQKKKLREMEDLLVQERVRRENAEAKAKKLEREQGEKDAGRKPLTVDVAKAEAAALPKDGESTTPIDEDPSSELGIKSKAQPADESATQKLQQRMDALLAEFRQVKESAEHWKREKEQAEKERDEERKERLSLVEMVEKMRREERERLQRKEARRKEREAKEAAAAVAVEEIKPPAEDEPATAVDPPNNGSPRLLITNGHMPGLLNDVKGGGVVQSSRAVQAVPYISAMSVVLVGVVVMTLINRMSKGEK